MGLELVPREGSETTLAATDAPATVAPASGPWLRLWLGDVPIWIDAGTLQKLIASKASGLLDGLMTGSPSALLLRGALPALLRMVLDMARAGVDNGTLDLPRPQPPRKGDVLAYFVSWATSSLVEMLTECDWRATYTETQDGGCAVTGLAPYPIVAGKTADGAGATPRAAADYAGPNHDGPDAA